MKTAKFLAIGLFASTVTGCSTLDHTSVEPWQGKVWRVIVERQFLDSTTAKVGREFAQATKYDASRDARMRIARVHLSSGWDSVLANAVVPDNIEFSQIERGSIVDVMTETGPNTDFSEQRYTRILRVVCAKTDDACIKREKSAKRIGAVIDEAPISDISAKYNVTYSRRVTDEELRKYK
jgi:hypothetical protein